jgi:hypothetical protein
MDGKFSTNGDEYDDVANNENVDDVNHKRDKGR